MELPLQTKALINAYLKALRQNPQHQLKPMERVEIYKSFGPSHHSLNRSKERATFGNPKGLPKRLHLSTADLTFGWLAIITSRKVLPIWLEAYPDENEDNKKDQYDFLGNKPTEMLKAAEGVLRGTVDADEAFGQVCGKFYDGLGALEYTTTEKVYCACAASYDTLEVILDGIDGLRLEGTRFAITDEEIRYGQRDFAAMAVRAYISIDKNEPGVWSKGKYKCTSSYDPLTLDCEKRLEFWEWWLTDAIPQAWELAITKELP